MPIYSSGVCDQLVADGIAKWFDRPAGVLVLIADGAPHFMYGSQRTMPKPSDIGRLMSKFNTSAEEFDSWDVSEQNLLVTCAVLENRSAILRMILHGTKYDFKTSYALSHAFATDGTTLPSTAMWLIKHGCHKTLTNSVPNKPYWADVRTLMASITATTPAEPAESAKPVEYTESTKPTDAADAAETTEPTEPETLEELMEFAKSVELMSVAEMNKMIQRPPVPKVVCFMSTCYPDMYYVRTDMDVVDAEFAEQYPEASAAGYNNVVCASRGGMTLRFM